MEIHRILDIYNKWINHRYGTETHFVLKKEIIYSTITKSMKTFKYSLWYVNKKDIVEIRSIKHTIIGATETKEKGIRETLEEEVIRWILNLCLDIHFKDMMDGKFKGYKKEE